MAVGRDTETVINAPAQVDNGVVEVVNESNITKDGDWLWLLEEMYLSKPKFEYLCKERGIPTNGTMKLGLSKHTV